MAAIARTADSRNISPLRCMCFTNNFPLMIIEGAKPTPFSFIIAHFDEKVNRQLFYFNTFGAEEVAEGLSQFFADIDTERQADGAFAGFVFEDEDDFLDARV